MPFEERQKEFLEGFKKLRDEFQCDFVSIPHYQPHETDGTWRLRVQPQIVDLAALPQPSPFVA
jgi:hypothetical protein